MQACPNCLKYFPLLWLPMGKATRPHLWHLSGFKQPNWDLEALNCPGYQRGIQDRHLEMWELPTWNASSAMAADSQLLFVCLLFHSYIYSLKWLFFFFLKKIRMVHQKFHRAAQHTTVFLEKGVHISSGREIFSSTGNLPVSWAEAPNHSAPSVWAT